MLAVIAAAKHQALLADQHAPAVCTAVHAIEVSAVDIQRQRLPGEPGIVGLIELAEAAVGQHPLATGRPGAQQRLAEAVVVANLLPVAAAIGGAQDPAVVTHGQ
ncbi:hypothetical protein D3C78_1743480 [compost metagenome]